MRLRLTKVLEPWRASRSAPRRSPTTIDLREVLESPGGDRVESLPRDVGLWRTVITDTGPRLHAGGRGYGWLVHRRDLPQVYGFIKRSWDGRPLANSDVLERVFRRDGFSTAAVPALLDITEEGDPVFLYFARPSASGPEPSITLAELLEASVTLQPGVVESLAVCLAATLQFFGHLDSGLVLLHGDLKPSNILVDEASLRFGVVDCEECAFSTPDGAIEDHRVVSTESWKPPEAKLAYAMELLEAEGSAAVSNAMAKTAGWDVWACGRLLALATLGHDELGRFEADDLDSWGIAAKCATAGASPILCVLVAQGLEHDPAKRLSARDFVLCVRSWQEGTAL